jgi:multidrug resistance efflux pump
MVDQPPGILRTAALVLFCSAFLVACTHSETPAYQGYVEAEFVRVAAPFAGTLYRLLVKRGQTIAVGTPLFALEKENGRLRGANPKKDCVPPGRNSPI